MFILEYTIIMTLDWNFSFVKINDGNPHILFSCHFQNGEFHFFLTPEKNPEVILQMKSVMTLLTYIAFFPNKDFTKIKLKTEKNQFAIHYLDKRFLDEDFLGIFSVTEYDTNTMFEFWGVEELFAEFIFDYFYERENPLELDKIKIDEILEWMKPEINDFYLDWLRAKQGYFSSSQNVKTLANKPNQEKIFEQWWDLQLIDEIGSPIIDLISYIDDQHFFLQDENEQIQQSLESMSISALKILIDQQEGWNIQYLKNRLRNEMGFSYVFFQKFEIMDKKYLLVMNSNIYHFTKDKCIQMFRGNEFNILQGLSAQLIENGISSDDSGQITRAKRLSIRDFIIQYIDSVYR